MTDFAVLGTIISQLFVLPFGSAMLGGLVLFLCIVVGMAKFGLGMEGAVIIGSGFLMLLSVTMLGIDLVPLVVIILMGLFAIGVLRAWRK
jgi:hypothetical protein